MGGFLACFGSQSDWYLHTPSPTPHLALPIFSCVLVQISFFFILFGLLTDVHLDVLSLSDEQKEDSPSDLSMETASSFHPTRSFPLLPSCERPESPDTISSPSDTEETSPDKTVEFDSSSSDAIDESVQKSGTTSKFARVCVEALTHVWHIIEHLQEV